MYSFCSLCRWVQPFLIIFLQCYSYSFIALFVLSALPKTWRTSLSCSTTPRRLFSTRQDPCTAQRRRRWDLYRRHFTLSVGKGLKKIYTRTPKLRSVIMNFSICPVTFENGFCEKVLSWTITNVWQPGLKWSYLK